MQSKVLALWITPWGKGRCEAVDPIENGSTAIRGSGASRCSNHPRPCLYQLRGGTLDARPPTARKHQSQGRPGGRPSPRNRRCGVPECDDRTRVGSVLGAVDYVDDRRVRMKRLSPIEGTSMRSIGHPSLGGAGLALRPTATHHGGDSEMTMRSRPAASSKSTTCRRVKRCSNLVPNRSRASFRMT